LIQSGLNILSFNEYDYSPYDILFNSEEVAPKKFRTKHLTNKIPLTFSLVAQKG